MTVVTGIVDAVSYLGLGHVFTANMTGNIVLMEFRLGGDSGISLARSVIALCCFMLGALVVGRMGRRLDLRQLRISALLMEAAVLFVAARHRAVLRRPWFSRPTASLYPCRKPAFM